MTNNIQEYVANKVVKTLEEKYLSRIGYLEKVLNSQKICYDGDCGYCGEFVNVKGCFIKEHQHCYECFSIICHECCKNDKRFCKICEDIKERRNFVNSF